MTHNLAVLLLVGAVNLNGPEEGASIEVPCVSSVTINVGQNASGGFVNMPGGTYPIECPTLCEQADMNGDDVVGVEDRQALGQVTDEKTREGLDALITVYYGQHCHGEG